MTLIATLLLALLGFVQDEPTPQELVAKLASDDFAVRMEATFTLRSLDREALPALRAASEAKDETIRRRAVAIIDQIERRRLIHPTLIRLDFHDRPLREVVGAIRERSGFPVALEPEDDPAWKGRRISLEAPGPLPFWEALDRLGVAGGVRHEPAMPFEPVPRAWRIPLIADAGPPVPTRVDGPFRANLVGLSRHREVTTGPMPGASTVREEFTTLIQVFAEPGLNIDRHGAPRLLDAVDDRGQDLRPETDREPDAWYPHYRRFDQGDAGVLQYRLALKLPAVAGRRIERLRGVLPIAVVARTDGPLVIPLDGPEGRSFARGGDTLTILKVERREQETSIRLTFRHEGRPEERPDPTELPDDGLKPYDRPHLRFEDHVQIRDAQGRTCWWNTLKTQPGPDGAMEMGLTVYRSGPAGAPAEIRYHGVVGTVTEVTFEFRDLPMP